MTKQTLDAVTTIAKLKVSKAILKIIVMDFYAHKKLSEDDVKALFKKYKLASV